MEARCYCLKMMEQAQEELRLLETQHPHRFDYLKLELKSFISMLESQHMLLHHDDPKSSNSASSPASSSSATTQASARRKRKIGYFEDQEMLHVKDGQSESIPGKLGGCMMERDRIAVVLQRAKCCLKKLQDFKTSLR